MSKFREYQSYRPLHCIVSRGALVENLYETAGCPPHQDILSGLQRMRAVAEEHAIGGGKGERITGRLFPGEMRRPGQQLPRLHAGKLREGAIRRLVTPDAL